MVFQQKLLEKADFIYKLTGWAMVWPASSDKDLFNGKCPKSHSGLQRWRRKK